MDFPGAKNISNEELLELPCDLLIPAAFENVITEENADNIKARAILELANGPITPEADEILIQKKHSGNSGRISKFRWSHCFLFRMGAEFKK